MENLWNQISKLSQADQMSLAHQIWNNLVNASDSSSISEELKTKVQRREKAVDNGEDKFISWEVAKAEIERKYKFG